MSLDRRPFCEHSLQKGSGVSSLFAKTVRMPRRTRRWREGKDCVDEQASQPQTEKRPKLSHPRPLSSSSSSSSSHPRAQDDKAKSGGVEGNEMSSGVTTSNGAGSRSCSSKSQMTSSVNSSDSGEGTAFAASLRCQPYDPTVAVVDKNKLPLLEWYSPAPFLPLATEEALLPTLMKYKKKEGGMFRNQPPYRQHQVRKLCRHTNVPLLTALSLRRHHIKNNNPAKKRMSELRLGQESDIKKSADLLEQAVEDMLRARQKVAIWTERDQKVHIRAYLKENPGNAFPPTPDFIFQKPVLAQKYYYDQKSFSNHQKKKRQRCRRHRRVVVEERVISCTYSFVFYCVMYPV